MKIPENPVEREQFYQKLVQQCLSTRHERFEFYKTLRNYYLFGTMDSTGCVYNKIASTVDTLCSFIYSPDAIRFGIHLGTEAGELDIAKVSVLSKEISDQWRISRTHINYGLAVKWSLVFGAMFVKSVWRNGQVRTYLVEPHQFGVLREDIVDLEDQEAFVHVYTVSRSQLESDLRNANHPRADSIMAYAGRALEGDDSSALSEGMGRLILSSGVALGAMHTTTAGGNVADGIAGGANVQYSYAPKVEAELVDMFELYVWNDAINNYQMVTMASPNVVVYDRAYPGVKGICPFDKLAPEHNLYDYFWGESFIARLVNLQEWRTQRMEEIMELLSKQVYPPTMFTGMSGIQEEKLMAFNRPNGFISNNSPTGSVEQKPPAMPSNVFAEIAQIDQMFDDQAGIGHVLQGKGEAGVRSRGQADLMARLGSARPKTRAIVVEETAGNLATKMLRLFQQESKQRLVVKDKDSQPLHFLANQFTTDYEVVVDSHSSSPIFVEDRKSDALTLLEAKAIDRHTLLDLFDPPNVQELQSKLMKMEEKEQAQAQMQMAMQQGGQAKEGT